MDRNKIGIVSGVTLVLVGFGLNACSPSTSGSQGPRYSYAHPCTYVPGKNPTLCRRSSRENNEGQDKEGRATQSSFPSKSPGRK